nr:hypothetical protein [Polynucleobacter sp. UK-Kesae-W10]
MLRLIFLQSDEITCNFECSHHAGTFDATVASADGQLNLFVHQDAGSTQQWLVFGAGG